MKKKVYLIVLVVSLICYLSVFIPPRYLWIAGFITYLIPFVLLFNLFLLIRDLKNFKLSFLLPLGILLAGWGFIIDTFHYSRQLKEGTIKVMSYNTRVFDIYDPSKVDAGVPGKMTSWIRNMNADIICLQEFYTEPDPSRNNTVRMINAGNDYQVFDIPVFVNRIGAKFGAVIFSRYPIINSGRIRFSGNTQNQAIFADVIIDHDTVRIYNLHLQSMHIDEKELINYDGHMEEDVKDLFGRLKIGFIKRSVQINTVKENILHCPYRVIVCGDFNDLPYSYAYHQLKDILNNSFTSTGKGFGFTYNGKLPFLRIDNQFYSDGIKARTLQTVRSMKYSDHFPLIGTYDLVKK